MWSSNWILFCYSSCSCLFWAIFSFFILSIYSWVIYDLKYFLYEWLWCICLSFSFDLSLDSKSSYPDDFFHWECAPLRYIYCSLFLCFNLNSFYINLIILVLHLRQTCFFLSISRSYEPNCLRVFLLLSFSFSRIGSSSSVLLDFGYVLQVLMKGNSFKLQKLSQIIKLRSNYSILFTTLTSMDIQPDTYRYINWLLFFLAASINSIPTQAFSGVAPIISEVYDISEPLTNAQTLFFPLSYIFILLPANYVIDKKGLKIGTLFCIE